MRSLVILAALMLAGCAMATPNIILVQPRSGDFVQCSSTGVGFTGAPLANSYVEGCVKQYEAIGFVQAEKLTPEEKSKIPPGGKITRDHQNFRGGTISIGGGGVSQLQGINLLCQDAIARSDRGAMMVHCQ